MNKQQKGRSYCTHLSLICKTVSLFVQEPPITLLKRKKLRKKCVDFSEDFLFTEKDGEYDDSWMMADVLSQLKKNKAPTTLDEKIDKVRKKRKKEEKSTKEAKGLRTDSTESKPDTVEEDEEELDQAEANDDAEESDEEKNAEIEEDDESISEFSSADEDILQKAGNYCSGLQATNPHSEGMYSIRPARQRPLCMCCYWN
eukprot:g43957.t1